MSAVSTGATVLGVPVWLVPAITTVMGTLLGMKGKTKHLDWKTGADVATKVALAIRAELLKTNSENFLDGAVNSSFRGHARALMESRRSSTWQTEYNAILNGPSFISNPDPKLWHPLVGIVLYVALNYDASRPQEFQDMTQQFIELLFFKVQQDISSFTYGGVQAAAGQGGQPTIENQSWLEKLLGLGGGGSGSGSGSSPAPSSQTAGVGGSDVMKIILAFILLGGIIFLVTKKGRR